MIKIIKDGKKEFKATCPVCGCEFSYELEDLQQTLTHKIVKCPCCGKEVAHKEGISQVAVPRDNTGDSISSDPIRVNDNAIYQTPEYKELSKLLEEQLKNPFYIECNKSKNPCETCSYYLKLKLGEIYVGDSPCQWCQYSGLKVTCNSSGSGVNGIK